MIALHTMRDVLRCLDLVPCILVYQDNECCPSETIVISPKEFISWIISAVKHNTKLVFEQNISSSFFSILPEHVIFRPHTILPKKVAQIPNNPSTKTCKIRILSFG